MKALPVRMALATLALLVGILICSEAFVLSMRDGVSIADLARPSLALFLLALAGAGFAYAHTRALVRELARLSAELRAPSSRPSRLTASTFRESQLLRVELGALLQVVLNAEATRDAERARTDAPLSLRVRFVAAMGHDLRSPLNAMLGFSDLLALERNSGWNTQQKHSLEILRDRTRDLLGLIDDMIDWAKLEAGELLFDLHQHAAPRLVERAIDLAKQRSGARGLRASVELEPGLPAVHVDEARVVQALLGLMDNAAKSDGSPGLTVRASRVKGEPLVKIEVVDVQLEIRETDRAHMFNAFRPSFAPSGRRIAGLSLGTAMARALIRAQGGDVWFEGRPERGTTFAVTLPTTLPTTATARATHTTNP